MSLATRCTSCGTVFRVVQDQLRVSEGWVRCGRCQAVFNALEALFDLARETPSSRPAPLAAAPPEHDVSGFVASQLPPQDADSGHRTVADEEDPLESRFPADAGDDPLHGSREERLDFVDARFPSELAREPFNEPTAPDEAPSAPPDASEALPALIPQRRRSLLERWRARRANTSDSALSASADPAAPGALGTADDDTSVLDTTLLVDESMLSGELPPPSTAIDEQAELAALAELMTPPGAASHASPTPTFVRQAERAARWQRPRVRASLAVAVLLLVGALGTQTALQFRDAFAARWPDARPALESLCSVFGCEIEPLRHIAALGVEASGLAPGETPDTYRLTLTLRNRDHVALATPAIDLSLTDTRGELIARRVLAPQELRRLPGRQALGVALEANSETPVELNFTLRDARVSGYTVELFYP